MLSDFSAYRARIDELLWANASINLEEKVAQLSKINPTLAESFKQKAIETGVVNDKGFIRREDAVKLIVLLEHGEDVEFKLVTNPQGWHFGILVRKSVEGRI